MSHKSQYLEVPYQSYPRIKRNVLQSKESGKFELFMDPSFPPDRTSLTYVYSGDDRYERTVFKRPRDIEKRAIFAGVGGTLKSPFPWRTYQKRGWFQAAVVTISLCVRYLEKVIPGYRNGEQNFTADYIGAFHFNVWRFGDWIECVVDDNLPVLDGKLMFCPTFGDPPELWGALIEKAYAKIMKTYEAIECGDALNALTDLTGAICEYYTPDVNPPENLFHILFKSFQNRSLMVCWRNDRRLTPTGFQKVNEELMDIEVTEQANDTDRYLHIITAVTKFPLADSRLVEVVRLKCPFQNEPVWQGKYSERDRMSWENLNPDFVDKFRPTHFKDKDEYWMTLEDFRVNFGGVIICSSVDPYRPEGFGVERTDSCPKEPDLDLLQSIKFSNDRIWKHRNSLGMIRKRSKKKESSALGEINVVEDSMTVKVDSTLQSFSCSERRRHSIGIANESSIEDFNDLSVHVGVPFEMSKRTNTPVDNKTVVKSSELAVNNADTDVPKKNQRSLSIHSSISDGESFFSTSDISLSIQDQQIVNRPKSAPMTQNRGSSGSLSHLTQSNFLATRTDRFRSHGAWRQIVHFKSKWTKKMTGASLRDIDILSKNPRILIGIQKSDNHNELSPAALRSKAHVLISLLQDYRNGVSTGNSLFVPIGFAVFKSKHPERDEKRSLSKLQLIHNVESIPDAREVKVRLDLDEGYYFIVPYCSLSGHEGQFLVRALDEKDTNSDKNGCTIS